MLNSYFIFTRMHTLTRHSITVRRSLCSCGESWLTPNWNERHIQRGLHNVSVRRIRPPLQADTHVNTHAHTHMFYYAITMLSYFSKVSENVSCDKWRGPDIRKCVFVLLTHGRKYYEGTDNRKSSAIFWNINWSYKQGLWRIRVFFWTKGECSCQCVVCF